MGNTLSPILADIYVNKYQKQHLHEIYAPNRIWKYVDDILIVTKMNKQHLENCVNNLNKLNEKIKFPSEFEHNKKLN